MAQRASSLSKREMLFEEEFMLGPTYSKGGPRFRQSDLLNGYIDNYFREKGGCVQSFAVINPVNSSPGPLDISSAIERAFVFPLYGVEDPRGR